MIQLKHFLLIVFFGFLNFHGIWTNFGVQKQPTLKKKNKEIMQHTALGIVTKRIVQHHPNCNKPLLELCLPHILPPNTDSSVVRIVMAHFCDLPLSSLEFLSLLSDDLCCRIHSFSKKTILLLRKERTNFLVPMASFWLAFRQRPD